MHHTDTTDQDIDNTAGLTIKNLGSNPLAIKSTFGTQIIADLSNALFEYKKYKSSNPRDASLLTKKTSDVVAECLSKRGSISTPQGHDVVITDKVPAPADFPSKNGKNHAYILFKDSADSNNNSLYYLNYTDGNKPSITKIPVTDITAVTNVCEKIANGTTQKRNITTSEAKQIQNLVPNHTQAKGMLINTTDENHNTITGADLAKLYDGTPDTEHANKNFQLSVSDHTRFGNILTSCMSADDRSLLKDRIDAIKIAFGDDDKIIMIAEAIIFESISKLSDSFARLLGDAEDSIKSRNQFNQLKEDLTQYGAELTLLFLEQYKQNNTLQNIQQTLQIEFSKRIAGESRLTNLYKKLLNETLQTDLSDTTDQKDDDNDTAIAEYNISALPDAAIGANNAINCAILKNNTLYINRKKNGELTYTACTPSGEWKTMVAVTLTSDQSIPNPLTTAFLSSIESTVKKQFQHQTRHDRLKADGFIPENNQGNVKYSLETMKTVRAAANSIEKAGLAQIPSFLQSRLAGINESIATTRLARIRKNTFLPLTLDDITSKPLNLTTPKQSIFERIGDFASRQKLKLLRGGIIASATATGAGIGAIIGFAVGTVIPIPFIGNIAAAAVFGALGGAIGATVGAIIAVVDWATRLNKSTEVTPPPPTPIVEKTIDETPEPVLGSDLKIQKQMNKNAVHKTESPLTQEHSISELSEETTEDASLTVALSKGEIQTLEERFASEFMKILDNDDQLIAAFRDINSIKGSRGNSIPLTSIDQLNQALIEIDSNNTNNVELRTPDRLGSSLEIMGYTSEAISKMKKSDVLKYDAAYFAAFTNILFPKDNAATAMGETIMERLERSRSNTSLEDVINPHFGPVARENMNKRLKKENATNNMDGSEDRPKLHS